MSTKRLGTVITCATGTLTGQLNITGINIVLPTVRSEMGLSDPQTHWLATVYVLVLAGLVMISGAVGDRFDKRRVLTVALLIYLCGSALALVSSGPEMLLAGRALSAVGGCALVPVGLAVLRTVAESERQLAAYMSAWGLAIGLGMALGPVIAGITVAVSGWRAFFVVMIVFGLAYLVGVRVFVPPTSAREGVRILTVSYLLMGIWMTGATAALIELPTGAPWPVKTVLIVGSAAVFVYWLIRERTSDRAALPHEALSNRRFTVSIALAACNYLAVGATLFTLALFVQDQLGISAAAAGLLNLPLAVTIAVGGQWSGRALSSRTPAAIMRISAWAIAVGTMIAAIGGVLSTGAALVGLGVGTAIAGFGFGAANTPVNVLSMSSLPASVSGAAGSMASASRQLGQSIGTALAGVLVSLGGLGWVGPAGGGIGYLLAAGAVVGIAVLMLGLPALYPKE